MRKRIFRDMLLVSLGVLAAALTLSLGVLSGYYTDFYEDGIREEADCLAGAADACGTEYLRRCGSGHRLTLIAADGTVLFDNQEEAASLENHGDREEVRQALATGQGESRRYSSTLSRRTINVARRLQDGTVLRLSDSQPTALSMLGSMLWQLLLLSLLLSLLLAWLAYRISRSITDPINAMDLEQPENEKIYPELQPLLHRLSRQSRQIAVQMREIEEKHDKQDAMRRDFTANVSHELRTPLTSISGYAEIIRDGIARGEDVERFAGKIYDESQRLITLVGDIIKLSQLEGQDVSLPLQPMDLYAVCQRVLQQLEQAAAMQQVTLQLDGEHASITGAEQIVEEMVFNVCDNAIKYNRPGGSVSVRIRQCVDGVELTVSDTGIGIPKEDLEHIFERFYRVNKSHSKEIGGTGLGLSIVKHGALFHHAALSVESQLGKGTTIRILF